MKISDLFSISIGNLIRRKLRTALTVLGVIIGTTSVVTMLSIGFGIREAMQKQLESEGSLTSVTVYPPDSFMEEELARQQQNYLDDKLISRIKALEHVVEVDPLLSTGVNLKQGKWIMSGQIVGVTENYLKGIKLAYGEIPKSTDKELRYLFGNWVIHNFYDSKSKRHGWDFSKIPDVDYQKAILTTFSTEVYQSYGDGTSMSYDASDGAGEGSAPSVKAPEKKYAFPTAGLVEGDVNSYTRFSGEIYVNLDVLLRTLKKVYGNKPIPGQPTTKNGRRLKFIVYSMLSVNVDKLENVESVQKTIRDMGFTAESNIDWINSSRKQTQMIQGMLGGIGVVSLVVAAIGIANTMMMSIYERTKEIGIIKVLGCDMNHIRDMFLIESGMIGLLGGILGMGFSYLLSYIANNLPALRAFFSEEQSVISIIPWWLSIASIVFAIFVGMLAGLLPSLRAMKLSPLAALRNE